MALGLLHVLLYQHIGREDVAYCRAFGLCRRRSVVNVYWRSAVDSATRFDERRQKPRVEVNIGE